MNYLIFFIWMILLDYVFFGLIARIRGKSCNFDCSKCDCWSCTNGTKYAIKGGVYPVRNWHRWCKKEVILWDTKS